MNSYVTTSTGTAARLSSGYISTDAAATRPVGGYVSLPAGSLAAARVGSYVASDFGGAAEYELAS